MTDDAFLLQALQILLDRGEPASESIVCEIHQGNVPPMLRKRVRDPVPHRAGTHHSDFAHAVATGWLTADGRPLKADGLVNSHTVPASNAIVETAPPSGPKAPPSTQACVPGVYSTTGTWNV